MKAKKNAPETLCFISMLNNLDHFMTHLLSEKQVEIVDALDLVSEDLLEDIVREENAFQTTDESEILLYKKKVDYICRRAGYEGNAVKPAMIKALTGDMYTSCEQITQIYETVIEVERRITAIDSELEELRTIEYTQLIDEIRVKDKDLYSLDSFICKVGVMSKQNYKRMSHNFENIYAMIFYLGTLRGDELHLLVIPKMLEGQIHRVLNSLGFEEFPLLTAYLKQSDETRSNALQRIEALRNEKKQLETQLRSLMDENKTNIQTCKSQIEAYLALGKVRSKLLMTRHFFVTAVSIPTSKKQEIMDRIEPFMQDAIVIEV